jgi:tetratricopeptide (TPR) repeat protein
VDVGELRDLYEARRLEEAWAAYERLDETRRASPVDHFYGGLTARMRRDVFRARLALHKGLQAQPKGDQLGQLRLTMGVVLREIGEYRGAIDQFESFIQGLDEYPDLAQVALGHCYYNLGLACRQAKELDRAMASYELAAGECRRTDQPQLLRAALQNLAWAASVAGDAVRALDALDEAEPLCQGEEAWAHQRVGRAFLESMAGEPRVALSLCEELLKSEATPAEVRSQACWVAGRVSLAAGHLAAAESLARQAQDWAGHVRGDNRCLLDAAELYRQVMMTRLQETGA